MREGSAPVTRRLDYAPPAFWIREVELVFDLDPGKTIVSSKLHIERNPEAEPGPLVLHGEDLTLLRVLAGGESVSFSHEGATLVIDNPPPTAPGERFVLEIRNAIHPDKNTQLSGLYTSGGGFFTQCEAEGFRRITYFLDRPDVMAVYTVTLRADKRRCPVLLSNGNLLDAGELDGGRHWAKWHDPFPKPSYLFALVAADLVARRQRIRARNGREHLLEVYVRRGDLDKTEHAMRSLLASVAWDEAALRPGAGPRPLHDRRRRGLQHGGDGKQGPEHLQHRLRAGQPRHRHRPRLRRHRERRRPRILPQLDRQPHHLPRLVPAEPEGGPDGLSRPGVQHGHGRRRQRHARSSASKTCACCGLFQFPEDAGAMAHPVRPDSYAEINNFYTATVYEKGAEVVRMMHTLVGRDGFAAGMTCTSSATTARP
jgi:aminopeptidase N